MARRYFLRDRRASIAVPFAAAGVMLLCLTGSVIDIGNVWTATRALQGATDLAAIAAASDPLNATAAADATAVRNNYAAAEVTQVTPGIYTPNPALPPAARFQPGPAQTANAVQVTMTHQQPLMFANIFALQQGAPSASTAPITTTGIAAATRAVSFGIGSGVASFNGGIVNAVLGATLGAQVSLSAVNYTSLASAQVDLFALAQQLALQVGPVGGTYKQTVAQTVTTQAFLTALANAAPTVAPVLQSLASAASAGAGTVNLSQLIDYGPYANQANTGPEPQITATASALSLVQAAAQLGAAGHLINLTLNANIPGLAAVTGEMTIGEPPLNTTLIAVDVSGTTIHTAQIRLYLATTLASSVMGGAVQLPTYTEVGYGTASLASVGCNALNSASTQVTLNVTPGLINGWIGSVTPAQMINTSTEPTPTPALFLNLPGLATVTGLANAQIGDVSPVQVAFNATDIQTDAVKTTNTSNFAGSLIGSLLGNLVLNVNVVGLGIGVPGLTAPVSTALAAGAAPVDQLISTVLGAAGVGVGQASTWVTGARCTAASLAG